MKTNKLMVAINLTKPINLNFDELIKPELPYFIKVREDNGGTNFKTTDGKYLQKQIPALYYFIHVLLQRQYTKSNVKRCKYSDKFVRMYSRDVEPLKSKNDFKYIWSMLKQLKVIECIDDLEPTKYRKSARTYYFKLREEYLNSIIVQHEVKVKKVVADKLNNNWKTRNTEVKPDLTDDNIQWQSAHQYQQIKNIRFDENSAWTHINQLLEDKKIDVGRYNTCVISINNIANGRIGYSESTVCNRIYSSVTGMPKELRQFILDSDGKPMVEIDFGSFNAYAVFKIINTLVTDFKSDAEKSACECEINTYRKLLLSGDFYTGFQKLFFPDEQLSRDQVKDIVLKHWFNAKLTNKSKYRNIMKIKLPQITEIINFLKVKNYKYFSHITMKLESELVNDIIYNKFIELNPDAKLYGIFDSFLVEQKYSEQLELMMLEEGSRYFNIKCVVRTKNTVIPADVNEPEDELIKQPNGVQHDEPTEFGDTGLTKCESDIESCDVIKLVDESISVNAKQPELSAELINKAFIRIFENYFSDHSKKLEEVFFPCFLNQLQSITDTDAKLLITPREEIKNLDLDLAQFILELDFYSVCENKLKEIEV
jgi:hypothetical protein